MENTENIEKPVTNSESNPKKKKQVTISSLKDVDISNPIYFDNEVSIYMRYEGKPIYIAYKNIGKVFYVVDNGTVKVCAVRPKEY